MPLNAHWFSLSACGALYCTAVSCLIASGETRFAGAHNPDKFPASAPSPPPQPSPPIPHLHQFIARRQHALMRLLEQGPDHLLGFLIRAFADVLMANPALCVYQVMRGPVFIFKRVQIAYWLSIATG